MKVLYCTSEAKPFASSGGLGDVAGSLPKALQDSGVECRVVMPLYQDISVELKKEFRYITNFRVSVGWRNQYCGVFEYQHKGVTFYFLDNEYYFKRKGFYSFYDDGERFTFFSRAILEMLCHIEFAPDIIHANDWQTALVPVYHNLYYRQMEKFMPIQTVFTIHNIQYQGKYGMEILEDTCGIGVKYANILEYDGCANFMKGAIEMADWISTVSPSYATEILDPWFSHGLDRLLQGKKYKLCGILNGIDVEGYNPETDPNLICNFNIETVQKGKTACKKELQEIFGLEQQTDLPLMAMVTRLVAHKGLDLVKAVAESILEQGIQLVILGSGEYGYESFFTELASKYPDQCGVRIDFVPSLASKIYAGADLFLMPSKSEPCGLSQMISVRYGTIPIVRETGGLKDSILDSENGEGNGFTFANYNAHDMLHTCWRAKEGYANKEGWYKLVKRAMQCDFSWKASAKKHIEMYEEVKEMCAGTWISI